MGFIESSGSRWIKKVEENGVLRIEHREYPIYPYGNYVSHIIELDKNNKTVKLYRVRNGWNGTGSDEMGEAKLDSDFETFYNKMKALNKLEDFEELKKEVQEKIRKFEEKIDEAFYGLFEELCNMITETELLERIKKTDRKELIQHLRDYFTDC